MQEKDILHESANFWVCKRGGKYEINVKADSCSYLVGNKPDLESAKNFIDKLEKYPQNIRYLLPWNSPLAPTKNSARF